jgi:hypothetical protein
MTPERIVKLDKLGFAWDCRKNNTGTSAKVSGESDDNSDAKEVIPPASAVGAVRDTSLGVASTNPTTTTPQVNGSTAGSMLRLGGFPLPKSSWYGGKSTPTKTVAAIKQQQQFKGVQMPVVQPAPSEAPVAKPPVSEPAAATLSSLPCEFFSFSKMTKFPKINLNKY